MRVIVLSGVSGSGKTFYANQLAKMRNDICIVSATDHFIKDGVFKFDASQLGKAHASCYCRFLTAMAKDTYSTIVVDNTNLSVEEISPYMLAAEAFGCQSGVITLQVGQGDVGNAAKRNIHGLTKGAVQSQLQKLQRRVLPVRWGWEHTVVDVVFPA